MVSRPSGCSELILALDEPAPCKRSTTADSDSPVASVVLARNCFHLWVRGGATVAPRLPAHLLVASERRPLDRALTQTGLSTVVPPARLVWMRLITPRLLRSDGEL